MSTTNKLIRHSIKPEQGVGFYLMPASMPMPESGGGGLLVYDANSQLHGLVLDADTGLWFDITTRKGPSGYGLTKYWTDKDSAQFEREVKFPEDMSESEEKQLRNQLAHVFIRPTTEENRNQTGYDSRGYPTGMEIDLDLFVDGEPTTPTTTIGDVPENGDLKTDRKVEGHRIQIGLRSNRGDHIILNRKNEYISSAKSAPPELCISNELVYQEKLASIVHWLGIYGGSIINRATGEAYTLTSAAVVTGPGSIAEFGIQFTGTIEIGTITAACTHILFWATTGVVVKFGTSTVSPQLLYTIGSWSLYYSTVPGFGIGSKLSFEAASPASISDVRVFDVAYDTNAATYYYNDIALNGGAIVVP